MARPGARLEAGPGVQGLDPANGSRGTSNTNLEIVNGPPSVYNFGDLNSLLHWNYTDGVSNFERRRNQYIYGSSGDLTNHALNPNYYQGNRNPFVDHPEYVWAIFGGGNNNGYWSRPHGNSEDLRSAGDLQLKNISKRLTVTHREPHRSLSS